MNLFIMSGIEHALLLSMLDKPVSKVEYPSSDKGKLPV